MPTPPLTPLAAAVLQVAPAPERVLEIECGEGEGALFLAREFPAARVRGVDSSAARVRTATGRIGLDPEGRIAFKQGKPSALPYPDGFFDLVVALDRRPAVTEVARVLRPGGWLILADRSRPSPHPGLGGWLLRRRLARHRFAQVASAAAGDGSFSVARLGKSNQADSAD